MYNESEALHATPPHNIWNNNEYTRTLERYVIISNYHLAAANNMVSKLHIANEVRFGGM